MFKKIFTLLLLSLIPICSAFAASLGSPESATTLHYADPGARRGLHVTFSIPAHDTLPGFELHSITPADWDNFNTLYADPEVVAKYVDGQTRTPEQMKGRYESWATRLEEGAPWVGYAVHVTSRATDNAGHDVEAGTFIGKVGVTFSDLDGYAMFFGLGHTNFWNQGWATRITEGVLTSLVPDLAAKFTLGDNPVKGVVAYARDDNEFSQRILQKYCATPEVVTADLTGKGVHYPRKKYTMPLEDLIAKRSSGSRIAEPVGGAGSATTTDTSV